MQNSAASPPTDLSDLEFPDWSGMDDSPQRLSPEVAFALIDQYAQWFPEAVQRCRENRPTPVPIEFVLRENIEGAALLPAQRPHRS